MAEKCGCLDHPIKSKSWEHCRNCAGKPEQVGKISRRGLCVECSIERQIAASTQMSEGEGPIYSRWIKGRARSLVAQARQIGREYERTQRPLGGN